MALPKPVPDFVINEEDSEPAIAPIVPTPTPAVPTPAVPTPAVPTPAESIHHPVSTGSSEQSLTKLLCKKTSFAGHTWIIENQHKKNHFIIKSDRIHAELLREIQIALQRPQLELDQGYNKKKESTIINTDRGKTRKKQAKADVTLVDGLNVVGKINFLYYNQMLQVMCYAFSKEDIHKTMEIIERVLMKHLGSCYPSSTHRISSRKRNTTRKHTKKHKNRHYKN